MTRFAQSLSSAAAGSGFDYQPENVLVWPAENFPESGHLSVRT